MRIKILAVIGYVLAVTIAVYSQDVEIAARDTRPVDESGAQYATTVGLGFSGGVTSGIGFAFRKHFANRFGIHLGFFGLGGKEESAGSDTQDAWFWANLGGQGMYTLHRHPKQYFRLYALAGVEGIVDGREYVEDALEPSMRISIPEKSPGWHWDYTCNAGAGIGIEFLILSHVAFAIELPLSVQIRENGFTMMPIPNASLIYFF